MINVDPWVAGRALRVLVLVAVGACQPGGPTRGGASPSAPRLSRTERDAGSGTDGPGRGAAPAPARVEVSAGSLRRDLVHIAVPRHHRVDPAGLQAVAGYLVTELEAAGFSVTRQRVPYRGAAADNVIAERAGTAPSRVLLATAHYDAVPGTPGADDNGSGVAALLGIARLLGPHAEGASLRLVAFAFEEQGLVGSRYYVRSLEREERRRIAGVFNLDMIAFRSARENSQRVPRGHRRYHPSPSTTGDFVSVTATAKDGALVEVLEALLPCEPGLRAEVLRVPGSHRTVPEAFTRSDHASFWQAGVAAVVLDDTAELRTPHYHTPADTLDTLDLDFTAAITRWVARSLVRLARGTAPAAGADCALP